MPSKEQRAKRFITGLENYTSVNGITQLQVDILLYLLARGRKDWLLAGKVAGETGHKPGGVGAILAGFKRQGFVEYKSERGKVKEVDWQGKMRNQTRLLRYYRLTTAGVMLAEEVKSRVKAKRR